MKSPRENQPADCSSVYSNFLGCLNLCQEHNGGLLSVQILVNLKGTMDCDGIFLSSENALSFLGVGRRLALKRADLVRWQRVRKSVEFIKQVRFSFISRFQPSQGILMRRILRRYITRGPDGRPIAYQFERLTDDGEGRLQLQNERTARFCSGCWRPVVELSELRGFCDWCHSRQCCVHCVSRCQVCSRQLCGSCRRGFGGPPPRTVCAACRQYLAERQEMEDQLSEEQTRFDRHVAHQRLLYQAEALRQADERMQLMARFQEARLGIGKKTKLQWVLHLVGVVAVKIFEGMRYVIRRSLP
jgi:hypothetical protein